MMPGNGPVRAVVATEFWHGATGRALAQGFRELGWLVDEVDIRDFLPHGRSTAIRIEGRVMRQLHIKAYNAAIEDALRETRADTLLTVKGSFIARSTLDRIRAAGVRTVNYYPDYEFERTGVSIEQLKCYDLVVSTKSFHLEFLGQAIGSDRVKFVQHGYSPLVHTPIAPADPNAPFARDICYIGNASPYKQAWLEHVARAFPARSMTVFGHRWMETAAGTALERVIAGKGVIGDFFAYEVGRSRINIALHMGPSKHYGWQDLVSTRTFEIPACGGFMLHIDNDEVRGLFDVPGEVDVFATPEELIAKIAYYLDHDGERRAIAARGHARAVPAYSVHARAAEIAALI